VHPEQQQNSKPSLVAVLASHLQPTLAPDDLWFRVQQSKREVRQSSQWWLVAVTAACLCAAALFYGSHLARIRQFSHSFSIEALLSTPDKLEFRSTSSADIQAWVRERTGMEVPLSPISSTKITLAGASILPGSKPAVAIAYQVNGRYAVLAVCNNGASSTKVQARHNGWSERQVQDTKVASWNMRDHSYLLAYSASTEQRDACGLCHLHTNLSMSMN
jgi:hypothetical protein